MYNAMSYIYIYLSESYDIIRTSLHNMSLELFHILLYTMAYFISLHHGTYVDQEQLYYDLYV